MEKDLKKHQQYITRNKNKSLHYHYIFTHWHNIISMINNNNFKQKLNVTKSIK